MSSNVTDLSELADALFRQFPELHEEDRRLAIRLYRMLCCGSPVPLWRLASRLHMPISRVEAILKRWPGVAYDAAGRIQGFGGLSLTPTPHRFEISGHSHYTWCAWDGLFIPHILGADANIHSHCPVTGERIRVVVGPHGIESVDPETAVMSFISAETARVRENVLLYFCEYLHFFRDREAGEKWLANHGDAIILTLEEAFDLGRRRVLTQLGGDALAISA